MKNRKFNTRDAFDAAFSVKIDAWQPLADGFLAAFGPVGFDELNELERGFDADNRKLAFLTFESRFAPLGGLAAVMRFLPACLKKYGEDVVLLTPLYTNIPAVKGAVAGGVLESVIAGEEFDLSWGAGGAGKKAGTVGEGAAIRADKNAEERFDKSVLSCYRDVSAPFASYYIGIEGRFTAGQNPYSYADSDEILDDSLAFCAAVPHVLARLGVTRNIIFHAHDWETAPIAVTSKLAVLGGLLESARTVLTLHNSFDSGIGADRKKRFFGAGVRGDTVLRCAIPLLNGPLTTVSAPFASELCGDPLQRTVFTNHLQGVFGDNPPIGIENGMFGRPYLQYTHTALSRARQGDFTMLLRQKASFRERMLEIVRSMDRPEVVGSLSVCGGDDGRPVLFMSGRLDLMQKGFDVIFRAIEKFPAGKAGLIFCPSSADGVRSSRELAMFREIAEARAGDIVIWPFRVTSDDYAAVVQGSSFLLMPSFYEPFGAATEGFMHGTPVIARATGGLMVQVRDGETGILYREAESAEAGAEWKRILGAPAADRSASPLYRSMVDEAHGALSRAAAVFADRGAYGRMMLEGMESLRGFSWDAAVRKYRRVYDAAARRGFFDN